MAESDSSDLVVVGEVTAASGLKGEVRIRSHTRPAEEILALDQWLLSPRADGEASSSGRDLRKGRAGSDWAGGAAAVRYRVTGGGRRGRHLIARLEGVTDRNLAELLVGQTIQVERTALPEAGDGEFYWDDLVGLSVVDQDGAPFGTVDHLLETGANDVLVVKDSEAGSEVLIPWIPAVIVGVDLVAQRITVHWDTDY